MRMLMTVAFLASGAATALAAAATAASGGSLPAETVAAIDAAIAQEMTDKTLPGAAVGVWIPGQGDYVTAKGSADLQTGVQRTTEDPFRIGSVTKPMVGTVVLQLAEAGKLSLDAPIKRWFPDFPNGDVITVDDLLRMRSGIWDSWTEEALLAFYADPLHPPSRAEMIVRSAAEGSRFTPPDRETVYTNMNFILLDDIVAAVTGKPTAEVLKEQVFVPLGMTQSELPTGSVLPGPLHGYGWNATTKVYEDKTLLDPEPVGGAGAAISSLADLATFTRALCKGTLVSPETQARRMTTEGFAGGNGLARYGEAVATLGPFCGHNGTIMGFSTEAWYLPAEDAVVVVSVNRLDADDHSQSGDLFARIVHAVFPKALE